MRCVGFRNHKAFLLFCIYCFLVELMYLPPVYAYMTTYDTFDFAFVFIRINAAFNSLLILSVGYLVYFHFYLAISGLTTISHM